MSITIHQKGGPWSSLELTNISSSGVNVPLVVVGEPGLAPVGCPGLWATEMALVRSPFQGQSIETNAPPQLGARPQVENWFRSIS